ncbi:hypothetical protein TWF696_003306 [Orbilia brochopaga]|uniref:Uncharacterized protein n=1 Tax=Orbilia brochopaga TaxID=3140254 RepID=A0AAV9U0I3_9PEZI
MRAGARTAATLCSATTPRRVIPLCHAARRRHQSTSTEGQTSSGTDSVAHGAPIPDSSTSSASQGGNGSDAKGSSFKKPAIKTSTNRKKWPIFKPWSMPMGSNTEWLKQYIKESGVEPTLEHYRLFQKKSNIYRIALTRKEFDDIITDVDVTGVPNWTTNALQKKRKDFEKMRDAGIIEKKPYILRITGAEEYINEMDSSMDSTLTLEKRYTNDDIDYEALFDAIIELDPTYVARTIRNPHLMRLRLRYIHGMIKLGLQEGTLGVNRDGSLFIGQEVFKSKLLAAGVDQHFLTFYKVDIATREIDFDFDKANETLVKYDEKGLDSIPGDPSLKIGTEISALPSRHPQESLMKSERLLRNSDVTHDRLNLTQKLLRVLDSTLPPTDDEVQATSILSAEAEVTQNLREVADLLDSKAGKSSETEIVSPASLNEAEEASSLVGSLEVLDSSATDSVEAPIAPSVIEDESPTTGTLEIEPAESADVSSSTEAQSSSQLQSSSEAQHSPEVQPPPEVQPLPEVVPSFQAQSSSEVQNETAPSTSDIESLEPADLLPKEHPSVERVGATDDSQNALEPEPAVPATTGQEASADAAQTKVEPQPAPPAPPTAEPQVKQQTKPTTPQPRPPIDDGFEYLRQSMMASQREKEKEKDKKPAIEDDDSEFDLDEEDFDDYTPPPPSRRPF